MISISPSNKNEKNLSELAQSYTKSSWKFTNDVRQWMKMDSAKRHLCDSGSLKIEQKPSENVP